MLCIGHMNLFQKDSGSAILASKELVEKLGRPDVEQVKAL